ncbi:uncharacterized protein JCM15063_003300 [Sporobolomyces koalae]|uniref:uncharacterized protein n=1 Tax=Sporobolomyces koalae TaxID=500713 RepID=UPI00317D8DC0
MHLTPAIRSAQRTYLYDLSIHGALFLSSTPESRRATITSYRDPNFLRTFYTRLRRNEEDRELRNAGYEWVSHCQGEANFLRPARDGTAIVFDDLHSRELTYGAGSLSTEFCPDRLRVSPKTGYLFHPSPVPRRASTSPYGPYSLLRSALGLEHFAESLEIDTHEGQIEGKYRFQGREYSIKPLEEGDVWSRFDQTAASATKTENS